MLELKAELTLLEGKKRQVIILAFSERAGAIVLQEDGSLATANLFNLKVLSTPQDTVTTSQK